MAAGASASATRPWVPGAATGIGSLPGTDPQEAARLVFGEVPLLPYLPELPQRGPGADMIGRAGGLLVDLPVEVQPSGWRLAGRPGRDLRRARDLLAWDLDALEEQAQVYVGPIKVQVCGPWTLAAALELPSGHRVVSDYGATRDLIESLTEGLRALLADLSTRLPSAAAEPSVVVQLDEPSLPSVLNGRVPTPSGYGTVRAVEAEVVRDGLRDVFAPVRPGGRIVHCCAADQPVELFRQAGADAIGLDLTSSFAPDLDAIGTVIDDGAAIWAGVVPSTDAAVRFEQAREPIRRLWQRLGFASADLAQTVVPTPTCGLAGASPAYVRRAMSVLRDVGQSLLDDSA
ncbi:MAG: methionine synthase [Actinobacteria bacterium]|nr:methionine synthase [Actinomycetota bacterium]